ncbi:MAG: tyrosine-protein phosphatase [Thermoanaerobaculales bacterium]
MSACILEAIGRHIPIHHALVAPFADFRSTRALAINKGADTHWFSFGRSHSLSGTLLLALALCSCASTARQSIPGACSNNLGSPIHNFCVVTQDVLWRGGRSDKNGDAWLIQKGVRTIVNLELIFDDKRALGQATVDDARNYKVGYFRIRDSELLRLLAPSVVDDHVAHFLAILSQQPKPVYVHCRYGENRTGVMVAAFRLIIEGASDDAAIEELKRYHGLWSRVDEGYIRSLSAARREEIKRKVVEWIPKVKMDAQVVCAKGACVVSNE